MTRHVLLAAIAIFCFLFISSADAHAQSFEVLNSQVKPGGLIVVKIPPSLENKDVVLFTFDNLYQPNKDGFVFVGVPLNVEPDPYVMYLVNRLSGERFNRDQLEIEVVETVIKIRPSYGRATPSKRRRKEVSAITMSYQKANHAELYAKGSFDTPLPEIFITSDFAINHGGVDLRSVSGTKISAINSGRVIMTAKKFSLEGNMVIIDHGSGIFSYYMHLSRINVKEGQMIDKDQVMGLSGATGDAKGPHLHLAVKVNGVNVDPLAFIDTMNLVFKNR